MAPFGKGPVFLNVGLADPTAVEVAFGVGGDAAGSFEGAFVGERLVEGVGEGGEGGGALEHQADEKKDEDRHQPTHPEPTEQILHLPAFRSANRIHPGTETPIALAAVPEKSAKPPESSNL